MNVLKDSAGKTSTMRVMSFIALGASIWFGILAINMSSEQGIYLSAMFLLAAFAPKALQKLAENGQLLKKPTGDKI